MMNSNLNGQDDAALSAIGVADQEVYEVAGHPYPYAYVDGYWLNPNYTSSKTVTGTHVNQTA